MADDPETRLWRHELPWIPVGSYGLGWFSRIMFSCSLQETHYSRIMRRPSWSSNFTHIHLFFCVKCQFQNTVTYQRVAWLIIGALDLIIDYIASLHSWLQQFTCHWHIVIFRRDTPRELFWLLTVLLGTLPVLIWTSTMSSYNSSARTQRKTPSYNDPLPNSCHGADHIKHFLKHLYCYVCIAGVA